MKSILVSTLALIACLGCKKPADRISDPANPYLSMCAPSTTDDAWYSSDRPAPYLEGLNVLHYPITTSSDSAQLFFNQGLVLSYGFNHAEAARSFFYATKLDSLCAMAYWGFAYVLGPNYNAGMDPDHFERAYRASQTAFKLVQKNGTLKEKALIEALTSRYVEKPPEDRSMLDKAYASAMSVVYDLYRDDVEIAALYAESLMDLHPWDLYDSEGQEKPWTGEILSTIQGVLELDPRHPGGHHFYIHAVEASKNPGQGTPSARIFDEDLVPGSGHLVHMPSHIYIRTGEYHKGSLANIRAVKVDSTYVTTCHAQGVYPIAYYPHNYHFLAATATLEGNSDWAVKAAKKVSSHVSRALMKEKGWGTLQHYYTIPYNVLVKFAMWQQVLAISDEPEDPPYPRAIQHYARGMAYAALGEKDKAQEELTKLAFIAKDPELKMLTVWDINSVYDLVQIALKVLEAEIKIKEGSLDEAIELLGEAIEIEDNLNYNEPPDWFFSVRHRLGMAYIDRGDYPLAIQAYIEDLKTYPFNGWALSGLEMAYRLSGDQDQAEQTREVFFKAWKTADIELEGSLPVQ